jgi:DNA polymerase III gamma/tau subunit
VAKVIKDPAPLLQASRVLPETLRSQAQALTLADLETIFQVLSRAEFEMRRAPHPRFVLEMALVEVAEVGSLQSLEMLLQRLSALEERLLASRGAVAPVTASELPLFSAAPIAAAEKRAPLPEPPPAPRPPMEAAPSTPPSAGPRGLEEGWVHIKRALEGKKRSLAALLGEAKGVHLEKETLIVILENGTSFARSTLDDVENRQLIAAAAADAFGRQLKVEYRFQSPSSSAQPSTLQRQGPALPERSMASPSQEAMRRHPLVQRAVELFGGHVVRVSERPPEKDLMGA